LACRGAEAADREGTIDPETGPADVSLRRRLVEPLLDHRE